MKKNLSTVFNKIIKQKLMRWSSGAFQGAIDGIYDDRIHGWIIDNNRPQKQLEISLKTAGQIIAQGPANEFRKDLKEAQIGNGHNGFSLPIMIDANIPNGDVQLYVNNKLVTQIAPLTVNRLSETSDPKDLFECYEVERRAKEWLETKLAEAQRDIKWLLRTKKEATVRLQHYEEIAKLGEQMLNKATGLEGVSRNATEQLSSLSDAFYKLKSRAKDKFHVHSIIESNIPYDDKKKAYTELSQRILRRDLKCLDLAVPQHSDPKVSIILVLYNKAELTYQCIRSIIQNVKVPFEIVVIDNNSSDRSQDLCEQIPNLKYYRQESNLGFLKACNLARRYASGEFILLLNNDSVVHENAVESALETFGQADQVGIVGAKILQIDGMLQEAGSIIWNDASCLGYGRRKEPTENKYNFAREVDYVSGAFLLLPTKTWDHLNGFDESFAPCYYEETDLCVRAHKAGLKVIYQPRSVITHYEFASSEASDFAVKQMRKNQKRFQAKHSDFLAGKYAPSPEVIERAATASTKKAVIFIDDQVPYANLGAGFPRAREIVNCLKQQYRVLICPMQPSDDIQNHNLDDLYHDVHILAPGLDSLTNALCLYRDQVDFVWVSRPHNMKRLKQIGYEKIRGVAPLIYDAEALFYLREELRRKLFGIPTTDSLRTSEIELLNHADVLVSVCEREAKLIRESAPGKQVFSIGHPTDSKEGEKSSLSSRDKILFVGNLRGQRSESPNVDSVYSFLEEFGEQINRSPFTLQLVGRIDPEHRSAWEAHGALVTGPVEDLEPYFSDAICTIAPTRFAAGIPHKVHESLAHRVPVFASELILSQCSIPQNRQNGLISRDFVKQLQQLNDTSWKHLVNLQIEHCLQDMDKGVFQQNFTHLISVAGTGSTEQTPIKTIQVS